MKAFVSSLIGLLLLIQCGLAFAQGQATWIWYPGDFEIWLSNQMQSTRSERDASFLPFWRLYAPQPQVNFARKVELNAPEEIVVNAEGKYSVSIDGRFVQGDQHRMTVPAGKHTINIQVYNAASPPAVYVEGKTVRSDGAWTVGPRPNPAPGPGAVLAASWNFDSPDSPPSRFKLPTREVKATTIERGPRSILVDFGEETIGFVKLKNLKGSGKLALYYGESREEAQSPDTCETFDKYTVSASGDFTADHSRAMRYVNIQLDEGMTADDVSLMYEYLPLTKRGSFRSSDEELNRIWDVAVRTLQLNTREFFLDGIKRDHWVWAGDAAEAYLMNYYSFFDSDTVKRTTWALRGADPVDMHINTILDYSLYWFIGIDDYYQYTGDKAFVKSIYPRMVTLMDFVLGRRNAHGMLEGLPGDWVFVDWAAMPKDGELSMIQLLFARSLDAMADSAELVEDHQASAKYRQLAANLKRDIMATFWDDEKHALVHSRKNGQLNRLVTRHPNMFALMQGYLDPAKGEAVKRNVLMNDAVPKITTPYMRFYELAALAESGQQEYVTGQIKDYWGGMLRDGASCFWEQYDPKQKGVQRYAMYGKAFGMSLCHAWGASPIYLLGKYYLGVKPTRPGYAEYLVEPHLGGLQWIEGSVPTPRGDIKLAVGQKQIKITAAGGRGLLRFSSARAPRSANGTIRSVGGNRYEMALEEGKQYVVDYAVPPPAHMK
jgi:alpha-L-rhamnosidase